MFSKNIIAAAAVLFSTANAHLAIQQPAPIAGSASKTPLEKDGSNFPCQGADLSGGQVTSLTAGGSSPLQFNLGDGANWAVHGGGSCQVSITYATDKAAQKDPKNWKVIHSWIGGCPTNAPGNLDPSAVPCAGGTSGTNCVDQSLTFEIPQEVKSGNAILAWTWFNNIGNREMYMNCAKVSISGGTGNVDSLPSLFTANIGNGCSTTEQFNTDFPNPGKYVTKDAKLNYPLKAPVGSCGSGAGSAGVASTPAASSSSGSTGASASASAASSGSSAAAQIDDTTAAASTGSGRGGKSSGGKSSSPGGFAEVSAAVDPAPAAAAAAAPAASAPQVQSTCQLGQQACSASGFYCIDESTFGLCNWGCALPQPVASGTKCSGGSIVARSVAKRDLKIRHVYKRSILGFNL